MTTLSTHDTKRGRMSGPGCAVPGAVAVGPVGRPLGGRPPRPADRIVPVAEHLRRVAPDGVVSAELRGRLHDYTEKAIREAASPRRRGTTRHRVRAGRTAGSTRCWTDPSPPNSPNWSPSWSRTRTTTRSARSCCRSPFPGIPDVYQGTELWEDSLVDPDNRRPVDYAEAAHRAGSAGAPEDWWSRPPCTPAATALTPSCTAAISRCWRPVRPRSTSWRSYAVTTSGGGDAVDGAAAASGLGRYGVGVADGTWTDRLTGARLHVDPVHAEDLFGSLPVALLRRRMTDFAVGHRCPSWCDSTSTERCTT